MSASKVARIICALITVLACTVVAGCSSGISTDSSNSENNATPAEVRIGTMPTEDILPAWVAEQKGIFSEEGVNVTIEAFDSAPALSSAITAGQVDMAMTDIMRAVKLCESGTPVVAEWVTLGESADQGRFGVVAAGDASFSTLAELAEYAAAHPGEESAKVGVAANTVPEYVFDALVEEAGLAPDAIPTTEIASLPERYGLAASGQIAGAALPNSLLTLAEESGMKVLADDSTGTNISQSIMVARETFAQENPEAIVAVARAWDRAVSVIASNPDLAKEVLFANANISPDTADIYVVSSYPYAVVSAYDSALVRPTSEMVEPVIVWMTDKGYGGSGLLYVASTGEFIAG